MIDTIYDLLKSARQQLQISETAALDAEILLAHVLKITRVQLYSQLQQPVNSELKNLFAQFIQRRAEGEPVAYITGYREFWSLPIQVTSATLIPRPETEILVECVLTCLPAEAICNVADLGTGSGAIALAIASERPQWNLVATDKMPAALAIAQQNAEHLQLKNIQFQQGDWCYALPHKLFDAIISNPPYINKEDTYWQNNTNAFEPVTALLAEEAGLRDIRNIIEQAPAYLKTGGWLILEHGYDQAEAVQQLLIQKGYKNLTVKRDLAGINRALVAQVP